MRKLDRLNFTNLYYQLGQLRGQVNTDDLKQAVDSIVEELNIALGYTNYIDTQPKTEQEIAEDHVESERYQDY